MKQIALTEIKRDALRKSYEKLKRQKGKITYKEWFKWKEKNRFNQEAVLRQQIINDYLDDPNQPIVEMGKRYDMKPDKISRILSKIRKHRSDSLPNTIKKNKKQIERFYKKLDKDYYSLEEIGYEIQIFMEDENMIFNNHQYNIYYFLEVLRKEGIFDEELVKQAKSN